MTCRRRGLPFVPKPNSRLFPSWLVVMFTLLCVLSTGRAQEQAKPASSTASVPDQNAAKQELIVVPAGTRLAMVLTHPVDSKTVHRGDDIYAQLTAPIAISDQVVIPAGTFVQGQVEKLSRQGSRGEFAMRSLSLMFANGYVANVNGTTTIESEEGTAWSNPGTGAKVGLFAAPFAGLGLGAAIGSAAHTTDTIPWGTGTRTISNLKGVAIGSMVGLAAGGATSLVLLARSHQFFVDVGSPMQVTLAQPLTLQAARVQEALRKTQSVQPITPVAPRPVIIAPSASDNGTCYTPGSPGTPPTVIPGIPATPNSPGTPDVVIPGTPASPPIPHPCP